MPQLVINGRHKSTDKNEFGTDEWADAIATARTFVFVQQSNGIGRGGIFIGRRNYFANDQLTSVGNRHRWLCGESVNTIVVGKVSRKKTQNTHTRFCLDWFNWIRFYYCMLYFILLVLLILIIYYLVFILKYHVIFNNILIHFNGVSVKNQ